MSLADRRRFLRHIGLTIGALALGPDPLRALVYQKKMISRKTAADAPAAPIDFRYSPGVWRSPVSSPGDAVKSFVTENGGVIRLRPARAGKPSPQATETITISIEGWDGRVSMTQKCDRPDLPVVRTSVSSDVAGAEMTAFSTFHEDEGPVDNVRISVTPGASALTLRIAVRSAEHLSATTREDDHFPRRKVGAVTMGGDTDRTWLFL
ncbi:MAG TPA: hypothetical protein VJO14_06825, partial [Bacteroidota bacterium]|nr:hypothetical protein [Bacteroidota bacterium]